MEAEQETEIETPEAQEPQEVSEELAKAREEARKYGWRPKEEFDLEPDNWVDADRFMEFPSTQVRVLRDENKQLRDEFSRETASFKDQLSRVSATAKVAVDQARERAKAEYDRQIEEIHSRKREAAENSDLEAYDRETRREMSLKPPQIEEPQPEQPQGDPLEGYYEKHEWLTDPIMRNAGAAAIQDAYQRGQLPPSATVEQQVAFAEAAVKRHFPHMFQTEEKPKPVQKVDGGGLGFASRGKTAADLPADARREGQSLVDEGLFKSLNDYAKVYFEQG